MSWRDETPDPDRTPDPNRPRRSRDRLGARVRRAGGIGLLGASTAVIGLAVGATQLAPYTPWSVRVDVDATRSALSAHEQSGAHTETARRLDQAESRAEWQREQLEAHSEQVRRDIEEIKLELRGLRTEIRQLFRDAR